MRIVSFAWTTKELIEGKKTVTRRHWTKQLVKEEDLVQAYDRSPRFKGKCVALIKILKVSQVPLCEIDEEEMKKEGFEGQDPAEFIGNWIAEYGGEINQLVWRVEFKVLELVN